MSDDRHGHLEYCERMVPLLEAEIERLTKERDNKAQEFEHLKTHFDKMKVMRDESDERVQVLIEALTPLAKRWEMYRTSDLSHYTAHNLLVDYGMWDAVLAALKSTEPTP